MSYPFSFIHSLRILWTYPLYVSYPEMFSGFLLIWLANIFEISDVPKTVPFVVFLRISIIWSFRSLSCTSFDVPTNDLSSLFVRSSFVANNLCERFQENELKKELFHKSTDFSKSSRTLYFNLFH